MKIVFALGEPRKYLTLNETCSMFHIVKQATETADEIDRCVGDVWDEFLELNDEVMADNFADNKLPKGDCLYSGNADLTMNECSPLISDVKMLFDYSEVVA